MSAGNTSYQTIIYDKSSGSIVSVLDNVYIKSKPHLAQCAGRKRWDDVSFLYFPHHLKIDPAVHQVRRLSSNFPLSIVSRDGMPLDFEVIVNERRGALESGKNCLVEFEGGMGDQLMESAAVLTAIQKYPRSTFAVRCDDQYLNILRRVPGVPQVHNAYVGSSRDQFNFVVSNHTNYISDPRGGMYGKSSLYGAWLGLDRVSNVVKIELSDSCFKSELNFLSQWDLSGPVKRFMIQFRSGSGHAKSWQHEKVVTLAELLHLSYPCDVFVVGRDNELQRGLPHIIDLTGRSTWWQTCLLESCMDVVVCIDSGVMHLARSLGVPYVALWGGTNAQCILGEEEQWCDIRLPLDCRDQVCFDCGRKTNACMSEISPDIVANNVDKLIKSRSVSDHSA
jgi:ADP-heptose:LPS heptosyltransferase